LSRGALGEFDIALEILDRFSKSENFVVVDECRWLGKILHPSLGIQLLSDMGMNPDAPFSQDHHEVSPVIESLILLESALASDRLDRCRFLETLLVLSQNSAEDDLASVVEQITGHLTVTRFKDVKGYDLPWKEDHVREWKERQDSRSGFRIHLDIDSAGARWA